MDIKVIIEIPEGSAIKYEFDPEWGSIVVDRVMPTAFRFPFNYGYIKDTHGEDGDPLDVIVFMSHAPVPGSGVKCQVIGMLEMEDEGGIDHKIVAVPVEKVDQLYGTWSDIKDVPEARLRQIRHFFENYKDLEPGKWVKLKDWTSAKSAVAVVEAGYKRAGK